MANNYDEIDLQFGWNGDYLLGHDGDLADTSDDALISLRQDLHSVAASALKDWELYPNFGASLDDFVGQANKRSTGDAIHDRLRISITAAGIVAEEDLEIRVIPVHIHRVLIIMRVNVMPTIHNHMDRETNTLVTGLIFDFLEQGVFFLDKPMQILGE